MKCIYCGCPDSKVLDSRSTDDGASIRRRRECVACGRRFTTYETIEDTPVLVIKNNGNRQAFDINKVKNGIIKSCEKRPVSMKDIDALAERIRRQVSNSLSKEVTSAEIGEMVMEGLKGIDEVAYIRFASVYRKFQDTSSFIAELQAAGGQQGRRQGRRRELKKPFRRTLFGFGGAVLAAGKARRAGFANKYSFLAKICPDKRKKMW